MRSNVIEAINGKKDVFLQIKIKIIIINNRNQKRKKSTKKKTYAKQLFSLLKKTMKKPKYFSKVPNKKYFRTKNSSKQHSSLSKISSSKGFKIERPRHLLMQKPTRI